MYALSNPFASPAARNAMGGMYHRVQVESGVSGATPHQLVQMLFDGYLEAVAQARGAIADGRADVKGLAIGRAVRIIEEGLRSGLDLRAGGSLARDLDDLYHYLALRLTQANLRSDDAALDECASLVRPLRDAWAAIAPEAEAAAA